MTTAVDARAGQTLLIRQARYMSIPRPRMRLDAHPTAMFHLRQAAQKLPADPLGGILAANVALIMGGVELNQTDALPVAGFELYADGQRILTGTLTG